MPNCDTGTSCFIKPHLLRLPLNQCSVGDAVPTVYLASSHFLACIREALLPSQVPNRSNNYMPVSLINTVIITSLKPHVSFSLPGHALFLLLWEVVPLQLLKSRSGHLTWLCCLFCTGGLTAIIVKWPILHSEVSKILYMIYYRSIYYRSINTWLMLLWCIFQGIQTHTSLIHADSWPDYKLLRNNPE